MNVIDKIEKDQMEKISAERILPEFGAGDTLKVDVKIVEGDKERVQAFEGLCIARSGGGLNENFTVEKFLMVKVWKEYFQFFLLKSLELQYLKEEKLEELNYITLETEEVNQLVLLRKFKYQKKKLNLK